MKFRFALLCSLVFAAGNAAACYTVYDRTNRVVYSAPTAPVDMRWQLNQTMPQAYPGGHLVFGAETDCSIRQTPAAAGPGRSRYTTVITEMRDPPVTIIEQDGRARR